MKRQTAGAVLMVALAIALAGPTALALEVGDPAPALNVKKWLAGEPVDTKGARGRLVAVKFWATWSAASRKAIRGLNRFQQQHFDRLAIVAITDEDEPVVRKFLDATSVLYRVALDNGVATKRVWMRHITGLPHAFIVGRDGRIAWHGEPEVGMGAALRDLLAGKFDPARYTRLNELRRRLIHAIKAKKVAQAMRLLDQMIAAVPEDAFAHRLKASILAKQGRLEEARDALLTLGKRCKNDPDALSEAARRLATARHLYVRDMRAALDFAQRAAKLTASKDARVLATLAQAHYELGHLTKAVETQSLAVKVAAERDRPELEKTHFFYRRERLRRSGDSDAK